MSRKQTLPVVIAALTVLFVGGAFPVMAATNQAIDDPDGGFPLTDSNTVEVTSSALGLVKQVWVSGSCLASSVADGGIDSCNANTTSIKVPSGSAVQFVIYVRNDTDLQIDDVRIQDLLDDTAGTSGGFTYSTDSVKVDASQLDTATSANIYAAVNGTAAKLDADDDTDEVAVDTSVTPDKISIGQVTGTTTATPVNVAAKTTFAVLFTADKN